MRYVRLLFRPIEIPSKISPDPRYLWYSNQLKEAKARIEYHISQKDGPVYLGAEVGLGKMSIAQRLRDEFAAHKARKVVLAFAPNLKTANPSFTSASVASA